MFHIVYILVLHLHHQLLIKDHILGSLFHIFQIGKWCAKYIISPEYFVVRDRDSTSVTRVSGSPNGTGHKAV